MSKSMKDLVAEAGTCIDAISPGGRPRRHAERRRDP